MAFVKVNTEDEALKGVSKEHVKVLPTFKFFKVRPSLYHHYPYYQQAQQIENFFATDGTTGCMRCKAAASNGYESTDSASSTAGAG